MHVVSSGAKVGEGQTRRRQRNAEGREGGVYREGMPSADYGRGERRELPQWDPGPKTRRKNKFGVFYTCQEAAGSKDSADFIAYNSIAEVL